MPTYSPAQLSSFPWIVSSGTMRCEDLIPSLSSALALILDSLERPPFELSANAQQLIALSESGADLSADSRELLSELCSDLFDMLQDVAPIGFSFGSHEGDGTLFGFWLDSDIADQLETLKVCTDDAASIAELLQDLSDHGVDLDSLTEALQADAQGITEEQAGADFAQALAEETGVEISFDWPLRHIDWSQAWQDLRADGYFLTRSPYFGTWNVWQAQ